VENNNYLYCKTNVRRAKRATYLAYITYTRFPRGGSAVQVADVLRYSGDLTLWIILLPLFSVKVRTKP
jgi:hypothetical protein